MPRLARLDAPGVLHHVMGRGIERRKILINKKDRNDFISRLAELAEGNAMNIYAWALLPNHFHILCKTKMRPLSASMRKVLTGYVVNFNKRHNRHALGRPAIESVGKESPCAYSARFSMKGSLPGDD